MLASRANLRFTRRAGNSASVSAMQDQPDLPVRKADKSVAKEWPFFVQRMGSTSDFSRAGIDKLFRQLLGEPLSDSDLKRLLGVERRAGEKMKRFAARALVVRIEADPLGA